MEETCTSYCTGNGYDNFVNSGVFISFFDYAYVLDASDIEIAQSKNRSTLYDFTFQVKYADQNSETSQFQFEESAISPEEG